MKLPNFLIISISVCICFSPSWAQRKALIETVGKGLGTPSIKTHLPKPTTAQLLAQTQAFVQAHGRRPLSCKWEQSRQLRLSELEPSVQQEIRLGTAIQRLFVQVKEGKISAQALDVIALRQLLEAYPNPHYMPQKTLLDASYVLEQAQRFIQATGKRPRVTIYDGAIFPKSKAEMTEEEREESQLGYHIARVLREESLYPPQQQAVVAQLRQLVESNKRMVAPKADQLLLQLKNFIELHQRLPKKLHYKNRRIIPTYQLPADELEEVHLARQVRYILKQVEKNSLPETPVIQELRALFYKSHPPVPRPEELVAQLHTWMAAHKGRRPRINIYKDNLHVPASQMTPPEFEEYTLAKHLEYLLKREIKDEAVRRELENIRKIPTAGKRN